MTKKRVAAGAVVALKRALADIYWYKKDLKSFLMSTINNPSLLTKLNWDAVKIDIVGQLISFFERNQDEYQEDILRLIVEVGKFSDFSHFDHLDDKEEKISRAKSSVKNLKSFSSALEAEYLEQSRIEELKLKNKENIEKTTALQEKLKILLDDFREMYGSNEPQKRGFKLEKILNELFRINDLDPKSSFKNTGEQIDGAFSFDGNDYLLEAKWEKELISAGHLDIFAQKIQRKLDNTLGLFISISGYSSDGLQVHSSGRKSMILIDGMHLNAVLENRINLSDMLLRLRRHAASTGNIYLPLNDLLAS